MFLYGCVVASGAKRTLTKSEIIVKVVAANLQSNEQDSFSASWRIE
jgi:hypothetical protein